MALDAAPRATPAAVGSENRSFSLVQAALLGSAGSALLTLCTLLPGSPFGPHAGGLWPLAGTGIASGLGRSRNRRLGSAGRPGPGLGTGHLVPTLLVILGVVFLTLAWVIVWRRTPS